MFGRITSITADDERIYVAETQPPVVRVYDRDGNHLLDIGSEGQGPGELKYPTSVSLLPNGNVLVRDDDNSRFTEFSPQGELVSTWPGWTRAFGSLLPSFVNPDGTVYFPAVVGRDPETNEGLWGYWRWGPEGKTGEDRVRPEIDYQRPTLEVGTRQTSMPMSPEVVTQFAPFGAWITGVSDEYRFEIRHFDGRVTVVERRVDRVSMSDEEREWRMKSTTASFRAREPDWSWNGPRIAQHLPTFGEFNVDRENRIWVLTLAPSTPVPGCDPDPQPGEGSVPCWLLAYRPDVFAIDGKYLGPVELPAEIAGSRLFDAYISERDLITSMQDEAGTIMVKRYRLVLPGE